MRTISKAKSYLREFRFLAKGLMSTDHPVLAHVIPMRRCNLSCAYCNEYDRVSPPVPLETMYGRLDKLAQLGTAAVIISGGEPLLHPDLDRIIARIRRHGMLAALIIERLPADARADPGAERGRAGVPADQHRQRHARRRFQEEPEGCSTRNCDWLAELCRIQGEHQFRDRAAASERRRTR